MEEKTIGKFISVLRRAAGMTQKELGERLFVSDKTVSRWERDECTPDLALIPAIADIFGVSTDELLRGERSDANVRHSGKSDRQFAILMHRQLASHRTATYIAAGISVFALIGAAIANIGFTRGWIGFCIAVALAVVSVLLQLAGTSRWMMCTEEMEDDRHTEKIRGANNKVVRRTVAVIFENIAIFGFVLPLAVCLSDGYTGLHGGTWLLYGVCCGAALLLAAYFVYAFFVRGALAKAGILHMDETERGRVAANNRLLWRVIAAALAIEAVLGFAAVIIRSVSAEDWAVPVVFDSYESLESYTEEVAVSWIAILSDAPISTPVPDMEAAFPPTTEFLENWRQEIYDDAGELLCTYYLVPGEIVRLRFSGENGDLPAYLYTQDALNAAGNKRTLVLQCLGAAAIVNGVVWMVVYNRKKEKRS